MQRQEIKLQWDSLGEFIVARSTRHGDPESERVGTNLLLGGTSVGSSGHWHSNGNRGIASVSTCCIDIDVVDSFSIC